MPSLVLSTRNEHKLREFAGMLPGWQIEPLPDELELPPETGATFEANALDKARAAAAALGRAAIADDSGICAFALEGRPGVRSARFAGEDATDEQNLDKLIADLAELSDKRVEYVCAIAYVGADGVEQVFTGRCAGRLISERRGDGGFGYDPCVISDDYGDGRTMAELSQSEKDAISHRGRAARDLLAWLSDVADGAADGVADDVPDNVPEHAGWRESRERDH
ncbi:MAG: RdgB/HAM1 family non-canonical purine NTP pyrophosphatase [Solirubrobacterales bacterium]